jgi:hypothetical protein
MATKKQSVYIEAELDWAETKLGEWKEYMDNNPIPNLKDRIEWKPTKGGGTMPMVVASIESQIKSIRDTMKEYLALLKEVNSMREAEEKRLEARGGKTIDGGMMARFVKKED